MDACNIYIYINQYINIIWIDLSLIMPDWRTGSPCDQVLGPTAGIRWRMGGSRCGCPSCKRLPLDLEVDGPNPLFAEVPGTTSAPVFELRLHFFECHTFGLQSQALQLKGGAVQVRQEPPENKPVQKNCPLLFLCRWQWVDSYLPGGLIFSLSSLDTG